MPEPRDQKKGPPRQAPHAFTHTGPGAFPRPFTRACARLGVLPDTPLEAAGLRADLRLELAALQSDMATIEDAARAAWRSCKRRDLGRALQALKNKALMLENQIRALDHLLVEMQPCRA